MTDAKITDSQRRRFWRLFGASTRAQNLDRAAAEIYRKTVLREEAGVDHLADVGRTSDFDAVCLRLSVDGDLMEDGLHFSMSRSRRIRALIDKDAKSIAPDNPIGYVNAVAVRSGMLQDTQDWREDLVEDDLLTILKMLRSYANRHRPHK